MSAFIVGKKHIDYLISAGLTTCRSESGFAFKWVYRRRRYELTESNASEVGQMLWKENVKSVACCYPNENELPGPCGGVEPASYKFEQIIQTTPAQTAQAVACLEYQSCEHPGWDKSEARAFCKAVYEALVRYLPGYEEAQWEVR